MQREEAVRDVAAAHEDAERAAAREVAAVRTQAERAESVMRTAEDVVREDPMVYRGPSTTSGPFFAAVG